MMRKLEVASISIVLAFVAAYFFDIGFGYNHTPSMPHKLYFKYSTNKKLNAKEIVVFCLKDSQYTSILVDRHYIKAPVGRCENIIKPIVAGPGDLVSIEPSGVAINGQIIENSIPASYDSDGLPLPHLPVKWSKRLDKDEYFLMSNHYSKSIDSRHFGVIKRNQIVSVAIPIY